MIYTFLGIFIGNWIFYILAIFYNMSFHSGVLSGSQASLFVLFGCIIGGAIGFGIELTLLLTRNYFLPFKVLFRKVRA